MSLLSSKFNRHDIVDIAQQYRLSVFLTICLILGGTSQNIVGIKLPIYLISLFLIATVLCGRDRRPLSNLAYFPIIIGGALLALYLLYLVPLPPSIWTQLPGRELVVSGYQAAGIDPPWLPLSLVPERTLFSVFDFLPLIAITLTMLLSAKQAEIKKAVTTIVVIAVLSVVLGFFQILSNSNTFYIYSISNEGFITGFFSNANHQSCFLAMALAISTSFGMGQRVSELRKRFGVISVIIITTGLILTGSIAGYFLASMTVVVALFLTVRNKRLNYLVVLILMFIIGIAVLDFLIFGSHLDELLSQFTTRSAVSRKEVFSVTLQAIKDAGFLGNGPGSFYNTYLMYEDPITITNSFVPQAHNDFLQILLELGWAGMGLTIVFIVWFLKQGIELLRKLKTRHAIKVFLYIASLSPILHSMVDYPLRTIALSTLFVFCFLSIKLLENDSF